MMVVPNGVVAQVLDNDRKVVINRGFNHGVQKGMKVLVYRLGDEIIDPETRKSLGRLEIICGEGVVEHVQASMATVVSVERKVRHKRTITMQDGPFAVLQGAKKEVDEPEEQDLPFRDVKCGCLVKFL